MALVAVGVFALLATILVGCVVALATRDDGPDYDRDIDCEVRRDFVEDEFGTDTPSNFC